jgi:hypothetical protein
MPQLLQSAAPSAIVSKDAAKPARSTGSKPAKSIKKKVIKAKTPATKPAAKAPAAKAKKSKKSRGQGSWWQEAEVEIMLNVIERIKPKGSYHWDKVETSYNRIRPRNAPERDKDSIK